MVLLTAVGCRTVLSLALAVLLGRYLAAEEFGYFVLVSSVFTVTRDLTDLGTGNLAIRDMARTPGTERVTLENLFGLRLVLSLIAAAGCVALALAQGTGRHQAILLAAAAVLILCCASALNIVFQLRQALLAPSLLSVIAQAGTVVAGVVLLGLGVAGALFATLVLVRELVVTIGTRQLAVRQLGYAPWPRLKRNAMRAFAGKAAIIALASLFYQLQFQGGIFFVELLRPEPELGAFAAAFRPLEPLRFLPSILMLPLVPLFSWLAAVRPAAFRRQAQVALNLCIGIGTVISVATAESAPAVLQFLYSAKFSEGPLSAVDALRWLSPSLGCSFVVAAIAAILLAENRERQLLQLSIIGLILYVGANLMLLPRYQFTGGAAATALATISTMLGGLVLLRQATEGVAPGRHTLPFLLPAVVLFGVLHFVTAPPTLQLVVAGLLSGMALIVIWRLPGVPGYRTEQASLTRLALLDGATPAGVLEANG